MLDPERRIALIRVLVLETEKQHPEVIEQRRPVDLVGGVLDLELFHRPGNRLQRGEVLPQGVRVKGAEPAVVLGEPDPARGGGVEMPPEIEEGATELIGCCH